MSNGIDATTSADTDLEGRKRSSQVSADGEEGAERRESVPRLPYRDGTYAARGLLCPDERGL